MMSSGHPAFCLAVDWPAMHALSGSWDCNIKIWQLETGDCAGQLVGHDAAVTCVDLDWASRRALSAGADGELKLWDLENKVQIWSVEDRHEKVTSMVVNWPKDVAVTGDEDGLINVWTLKQPQCSASISQHRGPLSGLALDLASSQRLLSASWDRSLKG